MKKIDLRIGLILGIAAFVAGCSSLLSDGAASAEAKMKPTQGNQAQGLVKFTQHGDHVMVDASFSGLTPGGHGFHIHEKGDCSAPDATSAGGHFNPTMKPHGHPDADDHHVGDLPMLQADANGNASLKAKLSGMTLGEGATSIIGRGLIVHAAPDDFKTQPTGNSGARVACGIIVLNK